LIIGRIAYALAKQAVEIDYGAYAIRSYNMNRYNINDMKYNPLIHNRRSVRLSGYDYSREGAYFITICADGGQYLFGDIVNEEMVLNDIGQIAYGEWLKTPELRPNVSLDVFVIMPNHMHGIILLNDDINDAVNGRGVLHTPSPDMTPEKTTAVANEGVCNTPLPNWPPPNFRSPSNNVGAIVRGYKSAVTKQINLSGDVGTVWQRNYHEHIIRDEKSYMKISNYIISNPQNWKEDKFYIK